VERKNLKTSITPISSVLASEDAHRGRYRGRRSIAISLIGRSRPS